MTHIEYKEKGFRHSARLWLPVEDIEHGAMDQIRNVSRHPELGDGLAVMPDCHQGFGVTIGSVVYTEGSVIPNAVGVDIGCGMAAIRTTVKLTEEMDRTYWQRWAERVEKLVPTGRRMFDRNQKWQKLAQPLKATHLEAHKQDRGAKQLGSLGGGNHFLESQVDEEGYIWFMVHSGSRGIGNEIAKHYHLLAVAESQKRGLGATEDLSTLTLDDQTAQDYIHDMNWAILYAEESRRLMGVAMCEAFEGYGGISTIITCAHNYAEPWKDGVVHRKGATYAADGVLGIIPGSMGTNSFIVKGKGNPLSYESCSHGAGRTMSRSKARKEIKGLTVEAATAMLQKMLDATHTPANLSHADEAPHAYKDVDQVIERQAGDLIDIEHVLLPLRTVKGGGQGDD